MSYENMKAQFETFHKQNPVVWALFRKAVLERILKGFKHYSVNAVFEHIRWESDVATKTGSSEFKLNNNYRPFYARMFHDQFPDHEGFFRTREQVSKASVTHRFHYS